MLLYAQRLYPANQAEPRLLNLTSTSFAQISASARFANAHATTQATIVLPAFARSLSADKKELNNSLNQGSDKTQ